MCKVCLDKRQLARRHFPLKVESSHFAALCIDFASGE